MLLLMGAFALAQKSAVTISLSSLAVGADQSGR